MWADSQGYSILVRYSDFLIRYGLQCKQNPTCSILTNVPSCCTILLSDFSQQAGQMANRAMSSSWQTMNLSMPLQQKRGGGGCQSNYRCTKMKIQSWSMLALNYLTFGGGHKFEMAPHTTPPHPPQTSGLLVPMMHH